MYISFTAVYSNKSASDIRFFASDKLYPIFCFVGVTAVISILYSLCVYRRENSRSHANHRMVISIPEGVTQARLLSYPKIRYSRLKKEKGKLKSLSSCTICMEDFRSSDLVRLLPECGHFYHVTCVDPWLRAHWSCPNCRNSTIPGQRFAVSEIVCIQI